MPRQLAADSRCRGEHVRRQQQSHRTTSALPLLPLVLLALSVQRASAQFLPGVTTATARLAATRACSVRYACPNFGYQRTPFSVSRANYNLANGRLCYAVTAANPCTGCVTRACRSTTGIAGIYHAAPDMTLKPKIGAGTTVRPVGGSGQARVGGPACVQTLGVVVAVSAGRGPRGETGLLMRKGNGPATVCLQYPPNTPFRRIGQLSGVAAKVLPARQACCAAALQFQGTEKATLAVWTRGAGPVSPGTAGCQACAAVPVATSKGAVAGRVWMDSDTNNAVTIGIDEGFEGIVVNLFRIVGARRTYLGCTQTDGTGAYRFAGLVSDTYSVQMVLPAAGARATIRFAQRRAGPNTSNVSAAGQSDVLQVKTASVGVNALIQIIAAGTA